MSRFIIYVEEDTRFVMPGVRILDFSGFDAETVDPIEAGDGLALVMDAHTLYQSFVTIGPEETDYRRAGVFDTRLRRWQVYPFADNDDFRLQKRKPR